jgi:hypothetical protein
MKRIVQISLRYTDVLTRWVQTDMGNAGAVANGLSEAPVTVKESVDGMVSKLS